MDLYPRSLRQKVMLGYLIGGVFILALALFNWNNFRTLERMVISGDKISDFFDTALEIRRFEKNFFLYGKAEDYKTLVSYVDRADSLLKKDPAVFKYFAGEDETAALERNLKNYRALLRDLPPGDIQPKLVWEKSLRDEGKAIVTRAEELSRTERSFMQKTLKGSTRTIIFSLLLVTALGFITGGVFYRMFVRPLQVLEAHMIRLTEGAYSFIPAWSRDREIISLTKAFNLMLHELEWRQQHLIQSEKLASLGTLLFGVAHDLNNPLSNISTSSQILKEELEDADPEYKRELLRQIEEETERAKEIIRSLLEFSKKGKREAVNLKKTATESVRFYRNELPPKVEIRMEVPDELQALADKQQLQQVFLNLIKNAAEAISGEGVITISAKRAGEEIEITVSDTGAGMEPEILSKIFNPFFTTKSALKGYGLGLFIAHKIIKEHGGTIDVSSFPGRGTTFLIRLPYKETEIRSETA
jgi:two-component system NtrC family sensor kinase